MSNLQSKSDALYSQVRQDILALHLEPGAPLRLSALSDLYGLGLTPLRECLNRLSAEWLVVPEHNKGFRVAPLSLADLLDLERSRSTIEGALFAEAVACGDEGWEARVVGSFHHLSKIPFPSVLHAEDELELWAKRHEAFHDTLISAAPSVWMQRFRAMLNDQLHRYHLYIQTGLRDLSHSQPGTANPAADAFSQAMALEPHQALYDVALSRDTQAAPAVFQAHSNLSIQAFEQLVALLPDATDSHATQTGTKTYDHSL
ncbi:GntR family transcriptional regulator [Rhodophyticola sp. CCM32]|uniref:GntR family transcriptional regulator n=1 Tax=Rhodophyticola sp. CCM32 TaxID=2916397 RepID=UPI00107F53FC|nr:GntR family transcriptional regulator [Rhodophyticola sp. CCM32]QBY01277.1 GntR family transcriptional regulator [Rhodophyticola sp. CCM32]